MIWYFSIFHWIFCPHSIRFMIKCVKIRWELAIYNTNYKECFHIGNPYIIPSNIGYSTFSLIFLCFSSLNQIFFYIPPSLNQLYQYMLIYGIHLLASALLWNSTIASWMRIILWLQGYQSICKILSMSFQLLYLP